MVPCFYIRTCRTLCFSILEVPKLRYPRKHTSRPFPTSPVFRCSNLHSIGYLADSYRNDIPVNTDFSEYRDNSKYSEYSEYSGNTRCARGASGTLSTQSIQRFGILGAFGILEILGALAILRELGIIKVLDIFRVLESRKGSVYS